jgi:hypothetical protein
MQEEYVNIDTTTIPYLNTLSSTESTPPELSSDETDIPYQESTTFAPVGTYVMYN